MPSKKLVLSSANFFAALACLCLATVTYSGRSANDSPDDDLDERNFSFKPSLVGGKPVPVHRVLVAYSTKVESLRGRTNLTDLIVDSVDKANECYEKSDINLQLQIVAVLRIAHAEANTITADLIAFQTGERDFSKVPKIRAAKHADLCVLLAHHPKEDGASVRNRADRASAFSVVHHYAAADNLSLAHELGHLQGADHELGPNSFLDPKLPYNHGYVSRAGNWVTVMAYPSPKHPHRVRRFSNPNRKYQGEETGTPDRCDNARMLNLTADEISKLHP